MYIFVLNNDNALVKKIVVKLNRMLIYLEEC